MALLLISLDISSAWTTRTPLSIAATRHQATRRRHATLHQATRQRPRAQQPCALAELEPDDEPPAAAAATTQPADSFMAAKDYLTFLGYIGGFVLFFYAIDALAKLVGK